MTVRAVLCIIKKAEIVIFGSRLLMSIGDCVSIIDADCCSLISLYLFLTPLPRLCCPSLSLSLLLLTLSLSPHRPVSLTLFPPYSLSLLSLSLLPRLAPGQRPRLWLGGRACEQPFFPARRRNNSKDNRNNSVNDFINYEIC